MKKIISFILVLCIALCASGCKDKKDGDENNQVKKANETLKKDFYNFIEKFEILINDKTMDKEYKELYDSLMLYYFDIYGSEDEDETIEESKPMKDEKKDDKKLKFQNNISSCKEKSDSYGNHSRRFLKED